jgi:hypothetical protein
MNAFIGETILEEPLRYFRVVDWRLTAQCDHIFSKTPLERTESDICKSIDGCRYGYRRRGL